MSVPRLRRPQKCGQPPRHRRRRFGLALPDHQRRPAVRLQCGDRGGVARAVACDLGAPIRGVVLGLTRTARTIVAVPEAAVHEDDFAHRAEDEIGFAGKLCAVQPIAPAIAQRPHRRAHDKLRLGVTRFDRAHDGGAFLYVEDIGAHQAVLRCGAAPASGASRYCDSQRTTGTHTASPTRCSAAVCVFGSG